MIPMRRMRMEEAKRLLKRFPFLLQMKLFMLPRLGLLKTIAQRKVAPWESLLFS